MPHGVRSRGKKAVPITSPVPCASAKQGVITPATISMRELLRTALTVRLSPLLHPSPNSISKAQNFAAGPQRACCYNVTYPGAKRTWVRDNPSFIRDGVFGFNPFHGGPGFAAFPSGHTAAICAVMAVLWMCCPRFRLLYALAIAAVAIGLVGADFHFLGDVIAGAFLGISTGWFTVVLWELGFHRVRADASAEPTRPTGIAFDLDVLRSAFRAA